ncbi:MAG: SDR family oxidoreductase [Archangium sp.]|nr:SDR family oxidoreductase [Archangium sp.]
MQSSTSRRTTLRTSKLHDKVVVITGASSGIGRAIARAAGANGARVALLARGEAGLCAVAHEVEALGGESLVLPVDVADASAVDRAAEEVVAQWGGIDVWVNNAIVTVYSPISRMTPEEYRRVIEVDYLGTVHGTLAALRHMRTCDAGTIVQIGSALGYRSSPFQSAYCASKAAVRGFTDSLRSELAHERSQIKVTMLQLPGPQTPRAVAPHSESEVIADAVLYAVEHRSEELWVGWSTIEAIIGQFLVPRMPDRYVSEAPATLPAPSTPRPGAALLMMARRLLEVWAPQRALR